MLAGAAANMTAVFDQHGLKFQYPQNWQLHESRSDTDALEICLSAPSGAFWSLVAFDRSTDGQMLMDQVIDSLDEQYDSLEKTPANDEIAGVAMSGYDVYFYCLDLLVTTCLRTVQVDQYNLMFMYQAENREFDQQELVFQAITTSLLMGLKSDTDAVL